MNKTGLYRIICRVYTKLTVMFTMQVKEVENSPPGSKKIKNQLFFIRAIESLPLTGSEISISQILEMYSFCTVGEKENNLTCCSNLGSKNQ